MASCEKCWDDAGMRMASNPHKSKSEHYHDLLKERTDSPCTPKEQAGQFWDEEKQCDRRMVSKP